MPTEQALVNELMATTKKIAYNDSLMIISTVKDEILKLALNHKQNNYFQGYVAGLQAGLDKAFDCIEYKKNN